MKIIITGSLGHISKPLTKALLAKGHQVVVISRDAGKQDGIGQLGAEAAIGSIQDTVFLSRVFTGADAVYTMVPPVSYLDANIDPVRQFSEAGQNYVEAIRQAGIRHVVNLSSWGAHRNNGTGGIVGTYYYERIMDGLSPEVSITHIRPASFYYNLFSFIPAIKYTGKIAANYGGNDRTVLVAPEDIAKVVAEELEKDGNGINIRYVASDELTCSEVARVLGQAIGKPELKWELIPAEQVQQNLQKAGLPPKAASLLVELQEGHHKGLIAEDYYRNKPVLGTIKIADFAKEFAMAYQKQVS